MSNSGTVFKFGYPIASGVGLGLSLPTCLTAAWSWYPKNSGFVGGIVVSGMGFGAFVVSMISGLIINPSDDPSYPSEIRKGYYEYYFDSEVAGRVKDFQWFMCVLILFCAGQACFTITIKVSKRKLLK